MAKRKSDQDESIVVEQVTAPRRSMAAWQEYLEKYPNLLLYVVGAAVLLLGGWWLYKEMIVKPKQKEAIEAMWQAERQFERDSFNLALTDPGGGYDGFLALADKFSGTPAGEMARYYAAICYLQTGDYDNAIDQMQRFDPNGGNLTPALKYGVLGDCYSEKEDYDKAASYYEKAADHTDNNLLGIYYLKKLGMLYEYQGNNKAAIKAYERLRKDYPTPTSGDWRDIEKYIYRAKQKI